MPEATRPPQFRTDYEIEGPHRRARQRRAFGYFVLIVLVFIILRLIARHLGA